MRIRIRIRMTHGPINIAILLKRDTDTLGYDRFTKRNSIDMRVAYFGVRFNFVRFLLKSLQLADNVGNLRAEVE